MVYGLEEFNIQRCSDISSGYREGAGWVVYHHVLRRPQGDRGIGVMWRIFYNILSPSDELLIMSIVTNVLKDTLYSGHQVKTDVSLYWVCSPAYRVPHSYNVSLFLLKNPPFQIHQGNVFKTILRFILNRNCTKNHRKHIYIYIYTCIGYYTDSCSVRLDTFTSMYFLNTTYSSLY